MVNLAAVHANIQGGTVILMGKYMYNTALYENWPSGTVAVRTAQETRMFGRIGEARGTTVFGIKRENVFCQLVDISDNLPID